MAGAEERIEFLGAHPKEMENERKLIIV